MPSTLKRFIAHRPDEVEVFDWWELRGSLVETIHAHQQGDQEARRELLRLLESKHSLLLKPGSPVPHNMPPLDMLKFMAAQALHLGGQTDDEELQRALAHVEGSAASPTLRRFARLTLLARRQASGSPSR
ncbi:hypothetical protein JQX13_04100 [Archangium violaceum]|uniref:hypothetical protein n=1 Tax=Archangium violaceum TaxID=83451 RepID=UPI00193C45CE|nr:hypothetical protein [Archangium violaceum]QRK09338.1 hypothetical protein JQX13_04100 [Archangium violaceum]